VAFLISESVTLYLLLDVLSFICEINLQQLAYTDKNTDVAC